MTLSLQGVKVLDLSRVLAGPLCGMMLGDLGAHVIKVERPQGGDESRGWGPPFDPRGESAYFLSCNRNKLGAALDLDLDPDRDVLRRLVAGADVVLDNFKRGTLERRGLDPDELLRQHPQLIWCTITGFGADSDRPGYDFVVQAESGWMAVTGAPDGEPMKSGMALADVLTGKDATIAILAALAARGLSGERTVAERRVFVSLAGTARAALINVAQNTLVSGKPARRWGNAHPNLVPYQLFAAADRELVIAVGNDAQWQGCCRALALDMMAADERLKTNAGRLEHRGWAVPMLAERVAQESASSLAAKLDAEGVPNGMIRTVTEVLDGSDASPMTGMPPSVPGSVRLPPPRLDEHGESIRRIGWDVFASSER